MTDKREQILARLRVLMDSVNSASTPVVTTARNRSGFTDAERPALAVLDGTERVVTSGSTSTRGYPYPSIMLLHPQIYALLLKRPAAECELIGPELSAYRAKLITTVLYDTTLRELIGTNGKCEYIQGVTDMQSGMPMEGEMTLDFAIQYFLNPSDLL